MKIAQRRRFAAGAILTSSAVIAGALVSMSPASAAIIDVSPSLIFQTDTARDVVLTTQSTFRATTPVVQPAPSVTFTRVGTTDSFTTPGAAEPNMRVRTTVNATNPAPANDGPAVAGRYSITVTQAASQPPVDPALSESCTNCFQIDRVSPLSVTSATPNSLQTNSSANVTVNGTGFDRATTIRVLFPDGTPDPNVSANGRPLTAGNDPQPINSGTVTPTTIQRRFVANMNATEGSRGLEVTSGDGIVRTCSACFTIQPGPITEAVVLVNGVESGRTVSNSSGTLTRIRFKGSSLTSGTPSLEFALTGAGDSGSASAAALRRVGTNIAYGGTFLDADYDFRGWAPGTDAYQPLLQKDTTSSSCVNVAIPARCRISVSQAQPPTTTAITPNTQQANDFNGQTVTVNGTDLSRGVALTFTSASGTAGGVFTCKDGVQPVFNSDGSVNTSQVMATLCTTTSAPQGPYSATVTTTGAGAADRKTSTRANAYTVSGTNPSASPSSSPSPTGSGSPTPTGSGSPTPTGSGSPTPTGTGSPGTDTNGRYVALSSPTRVLDSRNAPDNRGTTPGRKLGTTEVDLSSVLSGTSAQSVVLNLTVLGSDASGNAVVHAQGTAVPGTSNINFTRQQIQANEVVTRINEANKRAAVTVRGSAAHIVVDMVGYFTSANVTSAARTLLQTPQRVAGSADEPNVPNGGVLTINVGSNLPAGSTSAILNITVARASAASGFVVAYPNGTSQPATSNVNFIGNPGVQANEAIVKIGTNNRIDLKISRGTARLIVDVIGGFVPGNGQVYTGLTPDRFVDSRPGADNEGTAPGRKNGATVVTLPATVPANATGVVLNVTAVDAERGSRGFVVAYPTGGTRPDSSNVNFRFGATQANEVITRIGPNRQVTLEVGGSLRGTGTHLVVDLVGYLSNTGAAVTSPTPSSTATGSPSPTGSGSPRPSTSGSPSPSATASGSPTPSATASGSPSPTPSRTP